jgi:carbon-monoxide dehydrogenase medium subunit
MYQFELQRPNSAEQAESQFLNAEDPSYLAGGMTLIPTLKQRLANPSDLIDLDKIKSLKGISVGEHSVVIGAMTRHSEVANHPKIKEKIPALAYLASLIGDPQVRNRGTLGGSIANNDPASDYPGAVLGLNATIHTLNRTIQADEFFTGMFETELKEGELINKVSFPIPEKAAYRKFPNPASRYSVAGAFVAKTTDGIRVAITGAGPTVFRVKEAESILDAAFIESALLNYTVPADDLNSDLHASSEYRAHLVKIMIQRAVKDCEALA